MRPPFIHAFYLFALCFTVATMGYAWRAAEYRLQQAEGRQAELLKVRDEHQAILQQNDIELATVNKARAFLLELQKSVQDLERNYAQLDKFERLFEEYRSEEGDWNEAYWLWVNRSQLARMGIQGLKVQIESAVNQWGQPSQAAIAPTVKRLTDLQEHPVDASALCRDSTYSYSRSRRGTCSHHGGVSKWLQ